MLRKLRYGEADSILQLYTREFGRTGAIAKGVRRAGSRFGGRLEPFFRLDLVLHEGRSDLMTVTSAETLAAHANLRTRAQALATASRVADFTLRVLGEGERNISAYNLLANALAAFDAEPESTRPEVELAFRAKLLLTAGFSPEINSCVHCGAAEGLVAFSGSGGGVVCEGCRKSGDFDFGAAAHALLAGALALPLTEAPDAEDTARRQVERAISDTLAHHANVRVRPLA